jgi:AcrR family transcriptional regulator
VKKPERTYNSALRKEGASETRQAIIDAARRVFMARGYAAATMQQIAEMAGITLDTIYAAIGKKPALFRLLVESAISGMNGAVPAEQRDYVKAIRAEPDARKKLAIYAGALSAIQPRLAPLLRVLQQAALADPDLDRLWDEIAKRRAANMELLAKDLMASGGLRRDLSLRKIADILWSMNAPEFYLLLVEGRGWTPAEYEIWLADAWIRLLFD